MNRDSFQMHVISTATEYEALASQWHGQTIALVPTMGALHEGHASLIRMARRDAELVVVSIFVNPLQFGPQEDLSRYPRPKENDLALCRALGVDVVFYPDVESFYPDGLETMTTVVPPKTLTNRLCGAFRPDHFTGVATVVLKLLNVLRPTLAIFGEKDAQQLMVIRKMVQDLNLPVRIVGHPTVREPDGLAMSSRNRYLQGDDGRQAALFLFHVLSMVRDRVQVSPDLLPARATLDRIAAQVLAREEMRNEAGQSRVQLQYLEAVERDSFVPAESLHVGVKVLIAALIDGVRLIDNMDLG